MRKVFNNRGISLVELMVAVSLLSAVLASIYMFLTFSQRSFQNTEVQLQATDEARLAMITIDKDIRKAKAVTFDSTRHKAVEIWDSGMAVNVYTNDDSDPTTLELVQYKLVGDQLVRGSASLGNTPSDWSTIIKKVGNKKAATPVPIFTVNDTVIGIELLVLDQREQLKERPVRLNTSITVRSKGAMN